MDGQHPVHCEAILQEVLVLARDGEDKSARSARAEGAAVQSEEDSSGAEEIHHLQGGSESERRLLLH